jgi:ribosomal silencing factor RsfS
MTTRYQRGNQKPSIEEVQTTLWLQDTKGVIRNRQSKKDRQHYDYKIPKRSFFDWRLLITSLVSCSHSVVCPSLIDGFWLPLWYLVVIVWSVLLPEAVNRRRTDNTMTTRYQRGNQKPSIKEGQTTLWLQDTKEVIISRQSKKDRQHYDYKIPLSVLLRLTASDYPFGFL